MKKIIYLCCVLVATMSISCQGEGVVTSYDSFDEVVSLKSKSNHVSMPLMYPRNIFLCNQSLVVMNEKVDTLFQVFRMPDFAYKYSFGLKGDGPMDFNLPSTNAVSYEKDGFTLSDLTTLKHVSLANNSPSVVREELPFTGKYFNGLIKLTDKLYRADGDFEDEKEFYLFEEGKEARMLGDYPEALGRFNTVLDRNQAYGKVSVAKPDGTKFVSFYRSIRRYRIYNAAGEMLKDVTLNVKPGNSQPDVESSKNYIHTIAAFASDDYIYTLNLDMTVEEVGSGLKFPSIQVFTWTGKPVKQFLLDRFISSFAIDEANKKIYGVFVDDMDAIYSFDMDANQ